MAGVANADSLRRLRKEVRAAGTRPPPAKTPGPKLVVSSKAVYKPLVASYALPFPGEPLAADGAEPSLTVSSPTEHRQLAYPATLQSQSSMDLCKQWQTRPGSRQRKQP